MFGRVDQAGLGGTKEEKQLKSLFVLSNAIQHYTPATLWMHVLWIGPDGKTTFAAVLTKDD